MSVATVLYRMLIRLLPRAVRERDGAEMAEVFDAQLADATSPTSVALRAVRRFPWVLALEWRDEFRARSHPAQREERRGGSMESVVRMVRQGARSLAHSAAFTLSVIVLLGLGVGSVSAIFAVVDHVLVRPLPYPHADRLVEVQNGSHSIPTFREFHEMPSIELWAGSSSEEANLTGSGEPKEIVQATVTEHFFEMFGGRAIAGRMLNDEDFRAAGSVMISYGLWQTVFGGADNAIGGTIRIDGEPRTVVGVLDPQFAAPETLVDPTSHVWKPLDPAAPYITDRNTWMFSVAGRLRPGATVEQAEQEAARVAEARARAFPDTYSDDGVISTLPVITLHEATVGETRGPLRILLGAVTLLLLVACANVTHLFLARGVTRVREMSVRRALGAGTAALVGQLFVESMLLGIGGALAGVLFAYGALRAFLALIPDGLPRAASVSVDLRVLAFAAAAGLLTSLVFGLLPALRFARDLHNPLRNAGRNVIGSRSAQAIRNGIVVAEVAISLVLVAQAGWLLRSFLRLTNEELGFRTENIVTIPLTVRGIEDPAEWNRRMDAIRESLAATSGVQQAAFGLTMPLEWTGGGFCCWGSRPNFPGVQLERGSMFHPVSTDYFALLDMEIVAGRSWTPDRARATPVPAVISENLAIEVFGTPDAAIGGAFTTTDANFEVIGVAADNHHYGVDQEQRTAVYLPVNAIPFAPGRAHMAVLASARDAAFYDRVREAIWRVEPDIPIPTIRTLDEWSTEASAQARFESALFTVFGVVTLLLLAGGLAGTLFYMVSLQRRDMGIRLALGATGRALERVILTRGVGMAAIGVIVGGGGAWSLGRLLESRLYGVDARDLRTLGLSVAVLMVIALFSSWVPARRAAATNPMESLRIE